MSKNEARGIKTSPEFGKKLRKYREGAGLSQRDLAAMAGIDHTYLSKMENGYLIGSELVVRGLARVCGGDEYELLQLAGILPKELKARLLEMPVSKWRELAAPRPKLVDGGDGTYKDMTGTA